MSGTFEFSPSNISHKEIYSQLNMIFSVSFTPDLTTPTDTLESVTITTTGQDQNVILTDGINSASVTGQYTLALFPNTEIKYVDKGKSDKTQEPIVANGTESVPDFKEIISVKPDPIQKISVSYTITAKSVDGSIETKSYSHDVIQTYDNLRDWLLEYFENKYEE